MRDKPPWVDLDHFILRRRDELIDFFVNERGRDRAHAERVVNEALLHALVKWTYFDNEPQLWTWVRDKVCKRLFQHFESDQHIVAQLAPRFRDALLLRARGLNDAELAAALGIPANAVPGLMNLARQAALPLQEQM